MVKEIQKRISESKTARWLVLALVAFTMLCGYFITDMMAPLQDLLQSPVKDGGLGWSGDEYGTFTSAYGWFNVFLLMLIFGGMILDKMGVRFTGLMAVSIMIIGVAMKWFGVSHDFNGGFVTLPLFGDVGYPLLYASLGFALFGVGIEIAGITVSKIIVKWFKGREMALAMGLEMACARIGTGLAIGITPFISKAFGKSIGMPVLIGLILLCIGLLSFIVFVIMDKKRDVEIADTLAPEEPFCIKDIFDIIKIKGFWYIAILCVLFYSAVFPFLKYAPNLMIHKFGIDSELSGLIPMLLPFGTILLTPFFGNLYDRKGKGASIMLIGAFMLVFVHVVFSIPVLNNWLIALIMIIILGVGFSLVPSAMWPSVPKIIPENKLGTAYALIFWIQNWGLMGVPLLIGIVLDKYCIREVVDGKNVYDYTLPMIIFTCFGILSILFAYLLKREDKIKHFGLELPNIKK
ncbi:MAG: MFS transporter [Prevotellaceae bacterium]|jgi:MFS family permease|nr:MFS transporter [Prevotellaceae bacterium]